MPGDPQECRQQAQECLHLAHEATSDLARQDYTALADAWTQLANMFESDNALAKCCSPAGKSELIEVKISQGTLAEMIGTTRSRVSFFMNKFRKLGLIGYNGDIHVHNALLNVVLHDNPAIRGATEDD